MHGKATGSLALVALALVGCSLVETPPPPPLETPPAVVEIEASSAPPLRFGAPDAAEIGSATQPGVEAAIPVRVRFVLLPAVPWDGRGTALDDRTRAVFEPGTGKLELASVLAARGVVDEGATAEELLRVPRAALAADAAFVIPQGTTVRIALRTERANARSKDAALMDILPPRRAVEEIALSFRSARASGRPGELEWALALATEATPLPPVSGQPEAKESEEADERGAETLLERERVRRGSRQELLLLAPLALPGPARVGIAVPSPFSARDESHRAWIAVALEIGDPIRPGGASPAEQQAVARIAASLASERALATRADACPVHSPEPTDFDLWTLRRSIDHEDTRRRALVLLSAVAEAAFLEDAALPGSDQLLEQVARAVGRALDARLRSLEGAAASGGAAGAGVAQARVLAWEVDRATLETLLVPGNRDEGHALLARWLGVAFEGESLEDAAPLLARLRDHDELEEVCVTRNLLGLEDSRASVRVRAARWLSCLVPGLDGFEPLGDPEKRRAALDRLWARFTPRALETPGKGT